MKKIITTFLLFYGLLFFAQKPNDLFKQGNLAYKKGDYHTAISLYEKALENDVEAPELYYNLGNAYYKLNRIAPSIYFYEKAIKLAPGDEDVRYNLKLANRMKLDQIEQVPENILLRTNKSINRLFAYNTWAWLAVFIAFGGLFAFIWFLFTQNPNIKRITFVIMWISLLLLFFTWYNAELGQKQDRIQYAIIFTPKVDLKTEPNLTADSVVELHEGTKVKLLKADGDWYLVQLPDGKKAWIPATDIRVL